MKTPRFLYLKVWGEYPRAARAPLDLTGLDRKEWGGHHVLTAAAPGEGLLPAGHLPQAANSF